MHAQRQKQNEYDGGINQRCYAKHNELVLKKHLNAREVRTCEVGWCFQVYECNVGLFGPAVVVCVHDDLVHLEVLSVLVVGAILGVQTQHSNPVRQMDVLTGEDGGQSELGLRHLFHFI